MNKIMKKMIRFVLVGVVLTSLQLLGNVVFAKDIDKVDAQRLGAYYLSVMTGKDVAESGQVSLAYQFDNPNLGIPAAYVFNVEGQGFVIVSASDFCYPILGYSTEGTLDTSRMAPAFKAYFGDLARRIGYAQEQGVSLFSDDKQVRAEWAELYERSLPAETTKATQWLLDECWDQGEIYYPTYNKMCPSGPDANGYTGYAYVGCVATAMCQIMHYWKYPTQGRGYIGGIFYLNQGTSYQQYLGYLDINLESYTYDWANMPNQRLSYYSSETQKNACALLCYHAGVSVSMNYGFSGSGTQSSYVPDALKNKFRYASADYKRRSTIHNYVAGGETMNYTDDEWMAMVRTEIDAKRPIYYSGYSMSGEGRDAGGHAFVADGYKTSQPDKFHFNWGWGGQPNTWSDLRTGDLSVPYSYGGYNFYFGQAMVINIAPELDEVVCTPVGSLTMTASTTSSATFEWQGSEGQSLWKAEYGLASADSSAYQTVETTLNEITLNNLQPSTWYSIRVSGKCIHRCNYSNGLAAHDTVVWSDWSDTVKFYVGEEPLSVNGALAQQVVLMPNPAHDKVSVALPMGDCVVEVYSTDGRKVAERRCGGDKVTLNLGHLTPGTYLVKVVTPQGVTVKKLALR